MYSKGISWINDVRIPFENGDKFDLRRYDTNSVFRMDNPQTTYEVNQPDTRGRFPANLLVSDDILNDGTISKAGEYKGNGSKSGGIWNKSTGKPAGMEYGDKGTNSRFYSLDKWFEKLLDV
jgi:hypothetical protein